MGVRVVVWESIEVTAALSACHAVCMSSLLPALDGAYGDRPDAVIVGDESTSWEALAHRVDHVAARLGGANVAAVEGVASLDTIVAVLAGLRAGVPVVPIASDAGSVERDHILSDSGAQVVLGDPDWSGVALDRVSLAAGGARVESSDRADTDVAIILYTSGTTGPPKGVQITRGGIAAGLDGLADAWGWTPADQLAHGLPLFHVHGLILGVLGPLRVGAGLRHTVRPTPEAYASAVGQGASMLFGVPTVWRRIVDEPALASALADARLLVSGSAALPRPVFDAIVAAAGQAPIERYGMTETLITLSTRFDGERRPGTVGRPIQGVETRIVDDQDQVVDHDGVTIGNLQVRGATLFSGYLGLPQQTSAAYTDDGWFRTGDAATIDADGIHAIAGRTSVDIIKSGGYKIGAGEIENVLLSQPGVLEAAVVGVPDDDLGERVVAFVVVEEGAAGDSELVDVVASSLSVHKRPREIRRVDSLPRNALGKVQKKRLTDG